MKRYLTISLLVVGLAVAGVPPAYAEGRTYVGVRAGMARLVMAEVNDAIAMINDNIEWHVKHEELTGLDVISSDELEETRWGMDIEGYVG